MLRKLLLSAVGALAFVGVASAADLPVKGPVYKAVPAPVFNWSGWYGGINGGWGNLASRHTDAGGITTGDFDDDGGFFGLTLGRNWQAIGSSFVFGIEGDIAWADLTATTFNLCGAGCSTELRGFATLRARAGYSTGPALFYITGGAALGSFKQITQTFPNSETLWGWTAGAGIEFLLGRGSRWSGKVEYLYLGFEDGSNSIGAIPITVSNLNVQLVKFGLNYRW
jgi:outer membrane immunogenic protein